MKGYIEERAVEIANFIIDNNATVRQTAKQFGISKSTVHKDVTNQNICKQNFSSSCNKDILPRTKLVTWLYILLYSMPIADRI